MALPADLQQPLVAGRRAASTSIDLDQASLVAAETLLRARYPKASLRMSVAEAAIEKIKWPLVWIVIAAALMFGCTVAMTWASMTLSRGITDSCARHLREQVGVDVRERYQSNVRIFLLLAVGWLPFPLVVTARYWRMTIMYVIPCQVLVGSCALDIVIGRSLKADGGSGICSAPPNLGADPGLLIALQLIIIPSTAYAVVRVGPALQALHDLLPRVSHFPTPRSQVRGEACSICLCDLVDESDDGADADESAGFVTLQCSHKFHEECILPWISSKFKTCPLCRR